MNKGVCTIKGCGKARASRGWCDMHYRRWRKHGDPLTKLVTWGSPEARFWAKVNKEGPVHPRLGTRCWLWTGAKDPDGYGRFCVENRRRWALAHRFSYKLASGQFWPMLSHLDLDHRCHVAGCVNPQHLRPASHKLNLENRRGANRNSSSGIRGVYWDARRQKWRVEAKHNRKSFYGGIFDNVADAENAAINLRNRLFMYNDMDRAVLP